MDEAVPPVAVADAGSPPTMAPPFTSMLLVAALPVAAAVVTLPSSVALLPASAVGPVSVSLVALLALAVTAALLSCAFSTAVLADCDAPPASEAALVARLAAASEYVVLPEAVKLLLARPALPSTRRSSL